MPRQATPLTEVTIRHAITKGYTSLWDGGGLHLLSRNGGNFWRMKYRRPGSGKENRIALGVYPQMPLRAARAAAQDVHTLLRRGIDPAAPRAAQRSTSSPRPWQARRSNTQTAPPCKRTCPPRATRCARLSWKPSNHRTSD